MLHVCVGAFTHVKQHTTGNTAGFSIHFECRPQGGVHQKSQRPAAEKSSQIQLLEKGSPSSDGRPEMSLKLKPSRSTHGL